MHTGRLSLMTLCYPRVTFLHFLEASDAKKFYCVETVASATAGVAGALPPAMHKFIWNWTPGFAGSSPPGLNYKYKDLGISVSSCVESNTLTSPYLLPTPPLLNHNVDTVSTCRDHCCKWIRLVTATHNDTEHHMSRKRIPLPWIMTFSLTSFFILSGIHNFWNGPPNRGPEYHWLKPYHSIHTR